METSQTIGALAAALAKAQAELGPLVASHTAKVPTKAGGQYSYTYANLADALAACRSTLAKHEIAVVQETYTPSDANGIEIRTSLLHASGEWLRSGPLLMPVKGDAQAVGSAITYGRRYQLLAVVGLAPEDDDGASASANAPKRWRDEPKPPSDDKLEKLRASVDGRVKAYAETYKLAVPAAWSESCSRAGYATPPGKSPSTLGFEQLRKINDALKQALAAPRGEEASP